MLCTLNLFTITGSVRASASSYTVFRQVTALFFHEHRCSHLTGPTLVWDTAITIIGYEWGFLDVGFDFPMWPGVWSRG